MKVQMKTTQTTNMKRFLTTFQRSLLEDRTSFHQVKTQDEVMSSYYHNNNNNNVEEALKLQTFTETITEQLNLNEMQRKQAAVCLLCSCVFCVCCVFAEAQRDELSYEDLVKLRVVRDQYISSDLSSTNENINKCKNNSVIYLMTKYVLDSFL